MVYVNNNGSITSNAAPRTVVGENAIIANLKAEIARLTAEREEARAATAAAYERAEDAANDADSLELSVHGAVKIMERIRALATEAETNALAEIVKKAVDAETRDMRKALEDLLKAHESGWPDKQDWGAGDRARATIARLDQAKAESGV